MNPHENHAIETIFRKAYAPLIMMIEKLSLKSFPHGFYMDNLFILLTYLKDCGYLPIETIWGEKCSVTEETIHEKARRSYLTAIHEQYGLFPMDG